VHAEELVEKDHGASYMFATKKNDDLKKLYDCFDRNPIKHILIMQKMDLYIQETGEKIVADEELLKDPIAFISRLVEFYTELNTTLNVAFRKNQTYKFHIDACW